MTCLIVDEAHNCAPAGRGKYATDSLRTERDPHPGPPLRAQAFPDGHAPQRLLRELHGPARAAGQPAVRPRHADGHQGVPPPERGDHGPSPQVRTPQGRLRLTPDSRNACSRPSKSTYPDEEQRIHAALRRYAELRQANCEDHAEKFATDFVLMTLKKRLFSSPAAFLRTLEQHESSLRTAKKRKGVSRPTRGILQRQIDRVDEEYSIDDEAERGDPRGPRIRQPALPRAVARGALALERDEGVVGATRSPSLTPRPRG